MYPFLFHVYPNLLEVDLLLHYISPVWDTYLRLSNYYQAEHTSFSIPAEPPLINWQLYHQEPVVQQIVELKYFVRIKILARIHIWDKFPYILPYECIGIRRMVFYCVLIYTHECS